MPCHPVNQRQHKTSLKLKYTSNTLKFSFQTTVSEQRRKFLSSVAAAEASSSSGPGFRATSATIQNLEDHKVKIQVSVARFIISS